MELNEAFHAAGIPPPIEIIPDGQIHRFSTNGVSTDTAGWYVISEIADINLQLGYFGDWRTGTRGEWSSRDDWKRKRSDSGERIRAEQERRALIARVEQEKTARHQDSAKRAVKIINDSGHANPNHKYLKAKGVKPYGLLQHNQILVIPILDYQKKVWSVEEINEDGKKRFLPGGRKKGCFHVIGDPKPDGVMLVSEGWATGATLHEATGHPILVAFDTGNLAHAALEFRRSVKVDYLFCADDDSRKDPIDQNQGLEAATLAAEKTRSRFCMVRFKDPGPNDSDFNDLAALEGMDAVRDLINDGLGCESIEPLICNKDGTPVPNEANAYRLLQRSDWSKRIWIDDFRGKLFKHDNKVSEVCDNDIFSISMDLQKQIPRLSTVHVERAMTIIGSRNRKNEAREYLTCLVWDKKTRLDVIATKGFGASDTFYHRLILINFMIGAVARVMKPGCKMDNMIVLEGEQGSLKSTALEVIGGPWYAEVNESVQSKDFHLSLQGKMIIEIAELDSFSKAETTRIKQVITCQTDRYRKPYGHYTEDHPRTCVFVGSTNEDQYLRDHTGGRRFWPITCGNINVDWITQNRDQLFAEAFDLYQGGAPWWKIPEGEAHEEQEKRRRVDPWEETMIDYVHAQNNDVSVQEILTYLEVPKERWTQLDQNRVVKILRAHDFERYQHRTSELREWRYKKIIRPGFVSKTNNKDEEIF